MVTPKWVSTECQPTAIRDVLFSLIGVLDDPERVDRVLQVGGPDVVTYRQLLLIVAEVIGRRQRAIIPIPLLAPGLSSPWSGLGTPLPLTGRTSSAPRSNSLWRGRSIDMPRPMPPERRLAPNS